MNHVKPCWPSVHFILVSLVNVLNQQRWKIYCSGGTPLITVFNLTVSQRYKNCKNLVSGNLCLPNRASAHRWLVSKCVTTPCLLILADLVQNKADIKHVHFLGLYRFYKTHPSNFRKYMFVKKTSVFLLYNKTIFAFEPPFCHPSPGKPQQSLTW